MSGWKDFGLPELNGAGIPAINLMSSPGSGKTAILAKTLDALRATTRIGIIEGDIATALDAVRLSDKGTQVSLITTDRGLVANATSTPRWSTGHSRTSYCQSST